MCFGKGGGGELLAKEYCSSKLGVVSELELARDVEELDVDEGRRGKDEDEDAAAAAAAEVDEGEEDEEKALSC